MSTPLQRPGNGGEPDILFTKTTFDTGHLATSLTFAADERLYAATITGEILRYDLNPDGSKASEQVINTVINANGGVRAIIGILYDPQSTPDNPVLWVSHSADLFDLPAPDWSGKVSRLSGSNLENYEDVVINLPRSVNDHMSNSLAYGTDGAIYMVQGSNTAMGAPDATWGFRAEHLLNAAVLRIDWAAITSTLDVKTEEGGSYDPFASNAPVTIFASGIRNAYDLLWHSNGYLYVPTNGSAPGGNTPATPEPLPASCQQRLDDPLYGDYTGPQVPGITNVTATQNDYLFRAQRLGYYGHPNPARCEWVMNGGNPTSQTDPAEVGQYPIGTFPDRNWRGFAYDFGQHQSPNGVIEYQNGVFGGGLQGKLIVARYSNGNDLIVLTPGADGEIVEAETGIFGFTALTDPLDVTENPANGFLYVTEYGGANPRIRLLRPEGANLHLAQTATPHLWEGEVIHYVLAATNFGPQAAMETFLTDWLPADLTPLTLPDQCVGSSPVLCNLGTLSAGQTLTLTITAIAGTSGTLTNTATLISSVDDPDVGNNSATASTLVFPVEVDMSLGKTASHPAVLVNTPLTYTLTVQNNSNYTATQLTLTDELPATTLLLDADPLCTAGTPIICQLGTMAAQESVVLTLVVSPTVAGILTNTATLTATEPDPNPTNNSDTVFTFVLPPDPPEADLSLTKEVSTPSSRLGELLTYTLTVHHLSGDPAPDTQLIDELPDGVILLAAPPECAGTTQLICQLDTLTVGQTDVITLTVLPQTASIFSNSATLLSAILDPNPANNSATATSEVTPVADLSLTKIALESEITVGEVVSYLLTVRNEGLSPASQVVLTDSLPVSLTFQSATPTLGSCDHVVGVVSCEWETLAMGQEIFVLVEVVGISAGTAINHATLQTITFDPNPLDNTATTPITIFPPPPILYRLFLPLIQ